MKRIIVPMTPGDSGRDEMLQRPGHLSLGDLLTAPGSQITVRSDTFIIRAYGDARDAADKLTLANSAFGPHCVVQSFRWLAKEEISSKFPPTNLHMNFPQSLHPRRWTAALLLVSLMAFTPGRAPAQAAEAAADEKSGPKLRMICVSSLEENQELVLASKDEEGNWREFGTVKVRSPFISDWLPAATGPLHLAIRGADGLVSKCSFKYPEGTRRALLVMLPDTAKQLYQADIIDPAKLSFAKGSTLLVNYSPTPGIAALGTNRDTVKPGERVVMKPKPGDDGMYRMLVAYQDTKGGVVPCYDRYIPHNEDSRDFLLLFPDPTAGLRVFSLAEFGPFE